MQAFLGYILEYSRARSALNVAIHPKIYPEETWITLQSYPDTS